MIGKYFECVRKPAFLITEINIKNKNLFLQSRGFLNLCRQFFLHLGLCSNLTRLARDHGPWSARTQCHSDTVGGCKSDTQSDTVGGCKGISARVSQVKLITGQRVSRLAKVSLYPKHWSSSPSCKTTFKHHFRHHAGVTVSQHQAHRSSSSRETALYLSELSPFLRGQFDAYNIPQALSCRAVHYMKL